MKKKVLLIALSMFLMPMFVLAKDEKIVKEDYTSMNFKEVLEQEKIEAKFDNYEENAQQVTIYLFRGNGCGYCKAFLEFLNGITEEYGQYFKLESYEVWYDAKNSKLLEEVSDFLDSPAGGVPYIIIGDTVFPGYAEQYDESIKAAIKSQYESEERYDIFDAMAKAYDEENKVDYSQTILIITLNFVFTLVSTGIILGYFYNKTKKLNEKIEKLQIVCKDEKETKEVKKEDKKSTKTTSKTKTNTKNKKESK